MQATTLPALRHDLTLHAGPPDANGSPSWNIFDPIKQSYYRITHDAYRILSLWHVGSAAALLQQLSIPQADKKLSELIEFLMQHELVESGVLSAKDLMDTHASRQKGPVLTWLYRYFFFRIPLVQPNAALGRILPHVTWMAAPTTRSIMFILFLLALFLISRQFDSFTSTFISYLNAEGAALFAVSLFIVKIFHELGHALTAKYYGCRIPSMGLAFMFMFPILYTDTTDAWRINSYKKRLHIAAAGMMVEIALAICATLLWFILPDGMTKSLIYTIAAISWVLSLAINLNPFLKFDGYYLLSDYWSMDNLQPRAFALATWWVRRRVVGFELPPPESLPHARRTKLIIYAMGCWLYRLLLYTGIVIMIYEFMFKLLAIILGIAAVALFLGKPIIKEWGEWRSMAKQAPPIIKKRIRTRLLMLLSIATLCIALPTSFTVSVPAQLRAQESMTIHASQAGIIATMHVRQGQQVSQGDALFTLQDTALNKRISITSHDISRFQTDMGRLSGNKATRQNRLTLQQELTSSAAYLKQLTLQQEGLVIRAPFAGTITSLSPDISEGVTVNPSWRLGVLVSNHHYRIDAIANADDIRRLKSGASGTFIADDMAMSALPVTLSTIELGAKNELHITELSTEHQGAVASHSADNGRIVTEQPYYQLIATPNAQTSDIMSQPQRINGTLVLDASWKHPLISMGERLIALIIRESGF